MIPNLNIRRISNENIYKIGRNYLFENRFMSEKRVQYILKNYTYLWNSNIDNTNVYIYLKDNHINKWNKLLFFIHLRVLFMRILTNNKKYLEIWIYPLSYKKLVPNDNIIKVDNINSGMCISKQMNQNGVICLWRKEEILKVLLHEIIHSFKIDKNDPLPETYIEYRALFANIYLELLERNLPIQYVNTYLEKEKDFSVEQTLKINKYKNNNTNIHLYINEKGRLLHNMDKDTWNTYINKYNKPLQISKNSLRFTITEHILDIKPKSNTKLLYDMLKYIYNVYT